MNRLITEPGATSREGFADYRARGGYDGLARAVERGSAWVLSELRAAGLRGRGGGGQGLPAADKWARVAASSGPTRYVIANGAESSSVSRKDRFLMTLFPHRVLEGLLAAAKTVGARTAYAYVRGDAFDAIESMRLAAAEARDAGVYGPGTGCDVEVDVRPAVLHAVAGEETAVIDALEGLEGLPQPKPPYPQDIGLRGFPTVVNNVETLAAAAAILRVGAARFRAFGTPACPGTALFTVHGDVTAPGVYEVPYGTRLRELLEMAGAPPADELLAVLPGGFGSGPLRPDEIDLPLAYESMIEAGTTLGPAAVVVLRRGPGVLQFVQETAAFLAGGSCGQCRGCKEGGRALADALAAGDVGGARELAALLLHGRGNCGYPAGLARFALRALTAFPEHFPASPRAR